MNGGVNLYYIGKIDIKLYECICSNISTDEVVITEKQIEHITEKHKDIYDRIKPFIPIAIEDPDYILKDENHINTGLILKHILTEDMRIQLVLRLQTYDDINDFKNSVISAWQISESRWNNYIRNKIVLYKKE